MIVQPPGFDEEGQLVHDIVGELQGLEEMVMHPETPLLVLHLED